MLGKIKKINRKYIFYFIFLFSITIGAGIKLTDFSIVGIKLNFFRVIVPVYTLLVLYLQKRGLFKVNRTYLYKEYVVFIAGWVIYGFIYMWISKYSDQHEAFKELLSLAWGGGIVYCLFHMIQTKDDADLLIDIIRLIILITVVFSWIEILFNLHLDTSALITTKKSYRILFGHIIYLSSGFFYNVNDYCAFLSIFFPFIYINKRLTYIDWFIIISIILITIIDDANICLAAILLSYLFYKRKISNTQFKFNKKYFWIIGLIIITTVALSFTGSSIIQVIVAQVNNAMHGKGSLFNRIQIYKDSLISVFTTFGFGLGPASFSNYFKNFKTDELVNPHNYWLEILSQYGIIIFSFFVYFFSKFYRIASYNFKKNKDLMYLTIMCVLISFSISCIAPSSFLGYGYQWIIWSFVIIADRLNRSVKRKE